MLRVMKTLAATLAFAAMFSFASASPLPVGAPAPVVTALTETATPLDLGTVYQHHTYTLVYFYPRADTPGCTAQGCSLRDAYEDLTARGVAVIGVSTDKPETQLAFKEKYNLPFTLLADTERTVINAFGVPTTLGFAKRQAFLIKDGAIVWVDHSASTRAQADDVLAFLNAQS
jgi:thioredoxin-dependent peroxiredoxin